jgi:glycosyltransferase involved in cell wall biosynthesis
MALPPRVAIVIPCYNHGAYLPEAVSSALGQTHAAVECIVVDDGSTDAATRRVLDELHAPGLRVLAQSNQGLAAARNAGVRASDAPFFVPLDADDRLDPRFVERLLPALLEDERSSHAYCWTTFCGARRGVWRCAAYDPWRLVLHNLHPATALLRRAAFDAAGGYQTDMRHGYEDWDLWLALAASGWRAVRVAEPLFFYRQHAPGASMLGQMGAARREMRRRMIDHHHAFFQHWLAAWLGAAVARREVGVDALLTELEAAIEVDFTEGSRLWRWLGGRRSGPGSTSAGVPPSDRLRVLRRSLRYRVIQTLKAAPPYRWLARRWYPPEALRPTL